MVNTLRPRQNGRHFADDIYKCISMNENVSIAIKISLKFLPKGRINNIPALVQIMAWRRQGDKPLSEPVVVSLLTHICVTRPQWVNGGKSYVWMNPRISCHFCEYMGREFGDTCANCLPLQAHCKLKNQIYFCQRLWYITNSFVPSPCHRP